MSTQKQISSGCWPLHLDVDSFNHDSDNITLLCSDLILITTSHSLENIDAIRSARIKTALFDSVPTRDIFSVHFLQSTLHCKTKAMPIRQHQQPRAKVCRTLRLHVSCATALKLLDIFLISFGFQCTDLALASGSISQCSGQLVEHTTKITSVKAQHVAVQISDPSCPLSDSICLQPTCIHHKQ